MYYDLKEYGLPFLIINTIKMVGVLSSEQDKNLIFLKKCKGRMISVYSIGLLHKYQVDYCIDDIFTLAKWLDINCTASWSITIAQAGFENEEDAILFKLTWC
jgi:hypothetical protein